MVLWGLAPGQLVGQDLAGALFLTVSFGFASLIFTWSGQFFLLALWVFPPF